MLVQHHLYRLHQRKETNMQGDAAVVVIQAVTRDGDPIFDAGHPALRLKTVFVHKSMLEEPLAKDTSSSWLATLRKQIDDDEPIVFPTASEIVSNLPISSRGSS